MLKFPSVFSFLFSMLLLCAMAHAQYSWKSVPFYGGGYVPGIIFHPISGDGYIRTDVGGAYSLNADGSWNPLNDSFTAGNDMGSIAIFADETDPDVLYTTGGLYLASASGQWCDGASFFRSVNKGQTWTKIKLTKENVSGATMANGDDVLCLGGNGEGRGTGNRIAAKGDVIYLATNQNGLLKSADKGANWTVLTVASVAKEGGFTAVFMDKSGNVYAAPYAGGLYKSTDEGTTWSQVSGITGTVYQMAYSSSEDVAFITTNSNKPLNQGEAEGGKLWKLNTAGATPSVLEITNLPTSKKNGGLVGLAVSPDAQEIAVATSATWDGSNNNNDWNTMTPHGFLYYTTDGGATWKDIMKTGKFDATSASYANASNPHWVSAIGINPKKPGHVIFGTGFGIISTEDARVEQPVWKFTSKGIEETVPLGLASTTNGAALVSVLGDVDGAYYANFDAPPADRHKVTGGASIGTIYDLDYAGQNPAFMVMVHKNSDHKFGAYSTDGGKTWTDFASNPAGINPSEETNYISVSADAKTIAWNIKNIGIHTSTDSGKTWQQAANTNSISGFRVVADKVTPNTFYVYNPQTGALHKSTNGGTTWSTTTATLATAGGDWAYHFFKIFASPFNAGELWATQGANGEGNLDIWSGESNGVMRSTDGGATFSKVSGIYFATNIGFGKDAVYFVGAAQSANTSQSVYRSDDNGSTWAAITGDAQKYGEITKIAGDPCIYSRVYLGTSGRGIIYGEEPGNENTCPEREDYGSTTPTLSISAKKKPQDGVRLYFDGTRIQIQKTLPNGEVKSFNLRGER